MFNNIKNNKKQNGFTLAELLGVIIVIGVLGLIIFPTVNNTVRNNKHKIYQAQINNIEKAAGDWALEHMNLLPQNGKYIYVYLWQLKNGGYIDYDIRDPETGKLFPSDMIIKISKQYNNYVYEVLEDSGTLDSDISFPRTFTEVMTGNSQVAALDPDQNLRYVGPTPNNYVWFNKDANGNPERWRIIGVFDGQAKIIKDDYYNTSIMWDKEDENGEYSNNWATASLQLALNNTTDGYIKTIQTNDPTSYGYIDLEHVWNVGGHDSSFSTTGTRSSFYNAERGTKVDSGRPTTWTGAIGLMYPSDYGYASSGSTETCEGKEMYNWDTGDYKTECAGKSWLYDQNYRQWTLTPYSGSSSGGFRVYNTGSVRSNYVLNSNAARPVLYLKCDTKIVGGLGTFDQPYGLIVD